MSDRAPRLIVVAVALAVVAAACSSGGSSKTDPTTSSSTTTPESVSVAPTSTSTTTTIPGDATVEVLVLKAAPSGLARVPDGISDSGATNLAKAIRDEASPGGAVQLRQSGFVSGWQRVWASPDSVQQNTIFVYRFQSAAGAAAYAANRARELNSYGANGPIVAFTVAAPPGVGLHSESANGSFGAVIFSKGVYSVQAVSTDGVQADQSLAVVTLAQAQYALLP